uniref:Putative polyadenylate-binding protein-interacting protein 8-like n=1 Tax=Davidia involucrata TaxID=16924 RepID=A0A5B7AD94_DAVIN
MAAGAEMTGEGAVAAPAVQSSPNTDTANTNFNAVSLSNGAKDSDSKSEFKVQDIVDMLSKLKLNPLAKEFFPSSYSPDRNRDQLAANNFSPADKHLGNDGYLNNRRRRNNYNQGRSRLNGRAFRAQREDGIRRTVYVADIDQNVTEEQLAALFTTCGQVVDCRVCGDPHSHLRFAFVEFADELGARAALNLCGTMLGYYPVKVLPSKTAILPVNPTFLPRSEDEREMCARTVYCTNIDKKISQADVKNFFETTCGEVSRLRLLGDHVHSTRIAFVEFVLAECAIMALNCSGSVLGTQPIRVSPSKTPVRPRFPRPALH